VRKFHRPQVVHDLTAAYPEIVRLAWLLTGREDLARGVGQHVIRRAVPAWRTWATPDQQQNWFFHHTLLTTRRSNASHRYDPRQDLLLRPTPDHPDPPHDIEYTAFVRALRDLPFQQAEALLLFDILGFDLRRSAVTMDLSTTATANHLEAARRTLTSFTGTDYDRMIERTRHAALSFSTDEIVTIPQVQSAIRRYLWPRRFKRLLWLLILLTLAVLVWRFRQDLLTTYDSLKSLLQ
jgi:DNA-directed RNA polymerase specialized sigma24 family protein